MANEPRPCTLCNLQHRSRVDARFMATDATGLSWYDCGEHPPELYGQKVSLEPIAEWFARHGIPLPGAN